MKKLTSVVSPVCQWTLQKKSEKIMFMKKLLGIVVMGLLCCNANFAYYYLKFVRIFDITKNKF